MDNWTDWRKSSFSADQGACVEVRRKPGLVQVRDTKQADLGDDRPTITMPDDTFGDLALKLAPITSERELQQELPLRIGDLDVDLVGGWYVMVYKGVRLRYTGAEMVAFAKGCGEETGDFTAYVSE